MKLVEDLKHLGPLNKFGSGLWPRLKWLNLDNQNTNCGTHDFGPPFYESDNDM